MTRAASSLFALRGTRSVPKQSRSAEYACRDCFVGSAPQ
jgi:hypothetical protein